MPLRRLVSKLVKIAMTTVSVTAVFAGSATAAQAAELIDRPPPLPKPVVLRVGLFKAAYTAAFQDIPELLKGTNLTIETANFVRYADARTALLGGSIDVATISPTDLLVALSQGATNIVGLTGLGTMKRYPLVKTGVEVKTWKDLEGKSIGVAPGSWTWFQFVGKLQDIHAQYGSLHVSNIQGAGSNFVLALQRGDIDVALTWEPFESQAVVQKTAYQPAQLDFSDSTSAGNDTGMVAATQSAIAQNRAAIRLLLWAMATSEQRLNGNHAKFSTILQSYTGANPDVAARIAGTLKLGGTIDAPQLERLAKTFYSLGALPKDVSADVPSHFDATLKASVYKK